MPHTKWTARTGVPRGPNAAGGHWRVRVHVHRFLSRTKVARVTVMDGQKYLRVGCRHPALQFLVRWQDCVVPVVGVGRRVLRVVVGAARSQ